MAAGEGSAALFQQPLLLAVPVALGAGLALVGGLLALASPSFSFTMPRWLKYITNGTSVMPCRPTACHIRASSLLKPAACVAAARHRAKDAGLFIGGDIAVDQPQLAPSIEA